MPNGTDDYRAALLVARRNNFALTREMQQAIARIGLTMWETIIAQIASLDALGRSASARRIQLAASAGIIRNNLLVAGTAWEAATASGRAASFDTTLGIYEAQMAEIAALRGVPLATLGAVRAVPLSMLGVWEAAGSPLTWRTLLAQHAANGAAEVSAIVRGGIAAQVGPDELARRLRRYVVGAEAFETLFTEVPTVTGGAWKLDLRTLPKAQQKAAQQMVFNALRIGVTELGQARGEAEIQHAIRDPFIKALRWRLSPSRGATATPDECDLLAGLNWYGLGPGVFPVGKVPPKPHPHDRCELQPQTRPTSEIEDRKPNPNVRISSAQTIKTSLRSEGKRNTPLGRSLRGAQISRVKAAGIGSRAQRAVDFGSGRLTNTRIIASDLLDVG